MQPTERMKAIMSISYKRILELARDWDPTEQVYMSAAVKTLLTNLNKSLVAGEITDIEYNLAVEEKLGAFTRARKLWRATPPGPQRARFFQKFTRQAVADYITNNSHKLPMPIACKPSCAACCRINVDVTNEEAQLLAVEVKTGRVPIDMERLRRQAAWEQGAEGWAPDPHSPDAACVFLDDDQMCKVYEKRPMSCGNYLVIDNPINCDRRNGVRDVLRVFSLDAELLSSAAATEDKGGGMAALLLKELEHGS